MLAVLDVRFKLETPDAALHMSALHKPSNATKLYSRGACDQFEQTLKFNQDLVVSFLNSNKLSRSYLLASIYVILDSICDSLICKWPSK